MLKEIILDWVLFTFWETLIIVLFVVGKEDRWKIFKFCTIISFILSISYVFISYIRIPFLPQLFHLLVVSLSCSKVFNIKICKVVLRISIILGILFILDTLSMVMIQEILGLYIMDNYINIFLGLFPTKIIECIISIKGGIWVCGNGLMEQ